jgi:hypothetical protein
MKNLRSIVDAEVAKNSILKALSAQLSAHHPQTPPLQLVLINVGHWDTAIHRGIFTKTTQKRTRVRHLHDLLWYGLFMFTLSLLPLAFLYSPQAKRRGEQYMSP